ncbi:hypothetical protein B0H13DRAFT_1881794 [Mycena leptocephala]|nr:hypothetical protein B0H13DRAFT_1881794 [Mycena leptocephala]
MHTRTLPWGLQTSLILACGQADGAAYLPFCVLRALCARAEAAFFGLAPLPFLFAFVGSFRPPHAREGVQRDVFTSVKQLRPLPPCRAHLARISRTSRAPVDGGGWSWRSARMGRGMQMEKHAHRDGNAGGDGDGRMGCALAPLQVEVGTYPLLLPARLALTFALALTLVPGTPSPRPRCVVWDALASSCGGMPTHSRTRRDVEVRGAGARTDPLHRPPPYHPSRACLSFLDAYGYARAVELERGAGSGMHVRAHGASALALALAWVIGCSRWSIVAYPPTGVAMFFLPYVDTDGARTADLDILLGLNACSHESMEVGIEKCGSGLYL